MIWHNARKEDVAKELDSQPKKGLTDLNAGVRRSAFGKNTPVTSRKRSGFTVIMGKLFSPLSITLLAIAALSAAVNIGDFRAGAIDKPALILHAAYAGALLLSTLVLDIVLAARELSANSTIADIKHNALTFVRVRRNGLIKEILAEELVPGDIIQLEVGDIIPADGRLLITKSFLCDERAITGDDTPALKDANAVLPEETPISQRCNMAYAGTVAVTGRAVMLITETGKHTQIALKHGKRPRLISNRTPLVRSAIGIRSFGIWLVLCSLIAVLSIYALGLDLDSLSLGWNEINRFIHANFSVIPDYLKAVQGHTYADALFDGMLFFLTLVICTVPIGLPQNVMRSIAKGIASLRRDGVMLHRFKKTEIIGCTSVICTDKSGTLTLDMPSVRMAWPAGDIPADVNEGFWSEDLKYLMRCCTLCCDRKLMYNTYTADSSNVEITGDRTETAILQAYVSNGGDIEALLNQYPRCAEIPFDESRKLMTVIYDVEGVYMTVTKGAPDVLIDRCEDIDEGEINRQAQAMFDKGLKVIAVAVQTLSQLPEKITPATIECHLSFVGLLGLDDPCREDVAEAIDDCAQAGIRTVMITGDHPATAASLARRLQILGENESVITGGELAKMSDKTLLANLEKYAVFARITSQDKVRIIKSWQSKGACVLMTAGGMNDAPALHKADISCSVEATATDVAVDAADITLSGNSFVNIASMIRQGRRIRKNLRSLTEYSITCSAAQTILLLLCAILFRIHILALLPLLLLNMLLLLFVQPCFADEPADKGAMKKMPDTNDGSIIGRFEKYRAGIAALYIAFHSVAAYLLGTGMTSVPFIGNIQSPSEKTGITMAFITMAFSLLLHAYCSRSERPLAAAGIFRNYKLLLSILLTGAAAAAMTLVPYAARLMGFVPLGKTEWCLTAVLLAIQLVVWEYPKLYTAVKFKQ